MCTGTCLPVVTDCAPQALLREALSEWRAAAASRAALRTQLVSFVHKRRLGCLGDYFTTWHQFTVAMRPEGDLRLRPGSPLLSPRSPSQDRRLMRRLAAMAGGLEVRVGGVCLMCEGLRGGKGYCCMAWRYTCPCCSAGAAALVHLATFCCR
jgi:hypothetical protein